MAFDPTKPATIIQPATTEPVPAVGFDPTKPATVVQQAPAGFDPSKPASLVAEDITELKNPRFAQLEKEKQKYSGWFDVVRPEAVEAMGGIKNAIFGKDTPDEDIKAIAQEFGVDYETLRTISPFLHAVPPSSQGKLLEDLPLRILGSISAAGGDLPQFAAKKLLTDDPKLREAMDYVRELGEERTGLAEWVAQNIVPGKLIAKGVGAITKAAGKEVVEEVVKKGAKEIAKDAGKGAAIGAAFGLGGSREGEEVESTLIAASVGAVLPGALDAATMGAKKIKNIFYGGSDDAVRATDDATKEAVLRYSKNNEGDITAAVDVMYNEIKEVEDIVRGAALDKKTLTPDEAQRIVTELMTPDEKALAANNIGNRYLKEKGLTRRKEVEIPDDIVTPEAVAQEYIKFRQKDFAQKIRTEIPDLARIVDPKTGKDRPARTSEVLEQVNRIGKDEVDSKWQDQLMENLSKDAVIKQGMQLGDSNPLGKTILNAVGGRQFGVKVIDERSGIDAGKEFTTLNVNTNKVNGVRSDWRRADKKNPDKPTISNILRAAKKVPRLLRTMTADTDNRFDVAMRAYKKDEATGKLVRDFSSLSPAEQKVAQIVANFYDSFRNYANQVRGDDINPLNIPVREGFGQPEMTVRPTEYVIKMKRKLKDAESSLGKLRDLSSANFTAALQSNKDLQDLVAGMRLVDARKTDASLTDSRLLLRTLADITSGTGRTNKLYRVASTALYRKGSIPEYLREKNTFRLMDRYMDATLRNVFLRRPLERLAYKARVLKSMGMDTESRFIKRIILDNYGIRQWSAAKLYGEVQIKVAEVVDKTAAALRLSPDQTDTLRAVVSSIPENIANIQYNIYPNVLGMNGKAHLNNLISAWTKAAPELGGLYGYRAVGQSFISAVADFPRLYKKAMDYGLQPGGGFTPEYQEALQEGLARSTGWQHAKSVMASFSRAWMWSFSKTEDFNRSLVVKLGEQMAKDLAAGNRGALRALGKMDIDVRRAYNKAKGNLVLQEKILIQHINNKTAFNYNRASLNEVGVHLGPFFSTFTKWPTETLGDILADMRIKGIAGAMPRLLEKYAAIWAIGNAIDATLYYAATGNLEAFPEFDKSTDPMLRYWLGKAGISGTTPISSVPALIPVGKKGYEKSAYTPPLVDTLWNDVGVPVSAYITGSGDAEKVQAGLIRAMQTFTPAGGITRFLMRDIPMGVMDEEQLKIEDL